MGKVKISPGVSEKALKQRVGKIPIGKTRMSGIQPKVVHKIPGVTTMPDKNADKNFKKKLQGQRLVNKKPD